MRFKNGYRKFVLTCVLTALSAHSGAFAQATQVIETVPAPDENYEHFSDAIYRQPILEALPETVRPEPQGPPTPTKMQRLQQAVKSGVSKACKTKPVRFAKTSCRWVYNQACAVSRIVEPLVPLGNAVITAKAAGLIP